LLNACNCFIDSETAAARNTTYQHLRLLHSHATAVVLQQVIDKLLLAAGVMAAGVLNSALSMSPPDTMTEEDKFNERKRDILVLVMRFLADYGFLATYQSLCAEASMTLDQVGTDQLLLHGSAAALCFWILATRGASAAPNRTHYHTVPVLRCIIWHVHLHGVVQGSSPAADTVLQLSPASRWWLSNCCMLDCLVD
jgi:hypothetical protein